MRAKGVAIVLVFAAFAISISTFMLAWFTLPDGGREYVLGPSRAQIYEHGRSIGSLPTSLLRADSTWLGLLGNTRVSAVLAVAAAFTAALLSLPDAGSQRRMWPWLVLAVLTIQLAIAVACLSLAPAGVRPETGVWLALGGTLVAVAAQALAASRGRSQPRAGSESAARRLGVRRAQDRRHSRAGS